MRLGLKIRGRERPRGARHEGGQPARQHDQRSYRPQQPHRNVLEQSQVADATQLQHIDQALQRAVVLMRLLPGQPSVGTGEGAVHRVDALLCVQFIEGQAEVAPNPAGDSCIEGELTLPSAEQQTHPATGLRCQAVTQLKADTAVRIVHQGARIGVTVLKNQRSRQVHLHPVRTSNLAHLGGHSGRSTDDQQVVGHPERTDDDRADLFGRAGEQAPDREAEPDEIEHRQQQIRLGDTPVELALLHQPAFGSDVELALLRREQGHRGGPCDVPRQHGLVDLTQKVRRYLPCMRELVRLAWIMCGST